MRPHLLAIAGPLKGSIFHLDTDEVAFGRHLTDLAAAYDLTLSRRHFSILREGEKFAVRDLGSRNGTFVNGESVLVSVLKEGDVIEAGYSKFLFLLRSGDEVVEPGIVLLSLSDPVWVSGSLNDEGYESGGQNPRRDGGAPYPGKLSNYLGII